MPGITEWIVILLIVLLVFGANKLPQLGDALGRSIKNFRRAQAGVDEIEVSPTESLPEGEPATDDGRLHAEVVSTVSPSTVNSCSHLRHLRYSPLAFVTRRSAPTVPHSGHVSGTGRYQVEKSHSG